jgi:hypothetical protein
MAWIPGGERRTAHAALALLLATALACGSSAPQGTTGGGAVGGGGTGGGTTGGGAVGGGGTGGGGTGGATGGPVCPGADPAPSGYPTCHQNTDCHNVGAFCMLSVPAGCGTCMRATMQCATDADCNSAALVCVPYTIAPGPCTCPPYDGTQCKPACTSTSCAADEQCLASGHCQPLPCTSGYTCTAGLVCKVGDAAADPHGCVPEACTQGYACAAGLVCKVGDAAADAHGCAPEACSQGYTCPAGTTCAASSSADPHGCSPIHCSTTHPCPVNTTCDPAAPGEGCSIRTCTHDAECDCGACVNGACAPHLGVCVTLAG